MAPKKNNSTLHVKRPMNAFMLYRQTTSALFAKEQITNHELSTVIGQKWQTLSEDEKAPYFLLAETKKQEHKNLYPDYKYTPTKKDGSTNLIPNAFRKVPNAAKKKSNAAKKVVPKIKKTKAASAKITMTATQKVEESYWDQPALNATTISIFNDVFSLDTLNVFETEEEVLDESNSYEDKSCDLASPIDTTDGLVFFQNDEANVLVKEDVVVVVQSTFGNIDYFNLCNEEFMNVELF